MRASAAVLFLAAGSYVALLLGVIRGVLIMRMVGVIGRGLMQYVFLINRYTSNAHLGILHGLSKQLPLKIGAHDGERAEAVEAAGMTWVVTLTAVAAFGMCVWGLSEPTDQRPTAIAIVIGGGWLLTNQTYMLYRCVLRSWGDFRLLAYLTVIEAVAGFALAILGAWLWSFLGAMLGILASWLIVLLILHFYSGIRIRPNWEARMGLELLRVGLLVLLITLSDTLLRTVDGAVIGAYYDAYRFGLYSVGMQMAGYMFALPESAGFVIWPKIIEAWGTWGDPNKMRRHIELPTVAAATVMPFLAGVAHILLPLTIVMIVPEFTASIEPAQILTWGGIFLALPLAANSLLVASNREPIVIIVRGASGLALAGATYWLVKHEAPIVDLAYCAAAAYALASAASLLVVLPSYFKGWRLLGEFAACYLPTVWAITSLKMAAMIASNFVIPNEAGFLWATLYLVFFLAFYTPGMIYGNYHTSLVPELLELVRARRLARQRATTSAGQGDEK